MASLCRVKTRAFGQCYFTRTQVAQAYCHGNQCCGDADDDDDDVDDLGSRHYDYDHSDSTTIGITLRSSRSIIGTTTTATTLAMTSTTTFGATLGAAGTTTFAGGDDCDHDDDDDRDRVVATTCASVLPTQVAADNAHVSWQIRAGVGHCCAHVVAASARGRICVAQGRT